MDKQITTDELRHHFNTVPLPPAPFQLYPGTKILDLRKFIDSQFSIIDAGTSQASTKLAYDRLVHLYNVMATNQK